MSDRRKDGGVVIEHGIIDGESYRVWQSIATGKRYVFLGSGEREHGRTGVRRSVKWLRKQQRRTDDGA